MSKNLMTITSYPKSGNNYLKYLFYSCFKGAFTSSKQVNDWIFSLHALDEERIELITNSERTVFAKSHWYYSEDHPYKDHFKKCVYLCRNPLDILVSRKNHYLTVGVERLTTENGFKQFISKELSMANDRPTEKRFTGGWNFHVDTWLNENKEIPIVLVKYEDLIAKPLGTLTKLFENLDVSIEQDQILSSIERCSLDNMKKLEVYEITNKIEGQFYSEKRFEMYNKLKVTRVNKGKVGGYKEQLSPEEISLANEVFEDGMKLLGYI